MTRQEEVIVYLCALSRAVRDHKGAFFAADCFCHQGGPGQFGQFSDEILEFITDAINEKMTRENTK